MRNLWKLAAIGGAALVLFLLSIGGSSPPAQASETTVVNYWGTYSVMGFDETPQNYTKCYVAGPSCDPQKIYKPCYDCYITAATPDLEVDTGGGNWVTASYVSAVPARLHHMVLFNHARTDAT